VGDLEYRKLSETEIAENLLSLPGWAVRDGLLGREFEFPAYLDGADFAHRIARIADDLDHHPEIRIGWRKVSISVNTHAVHGISPYDFELARRIDALRSDFA